MTWVIFLIFYYIFLSSIFKLNHCRILPPVLLTKHDVCILEVSDREGASCCWSQPSLPQHRCWESSLCTWQQVHQNLWCVLLFRVVAMMPQLCQMSTQLKKQLPFSHSRKEGNLSSLLNGGSIILISFYRRNSVIIILCFLDSKPGSLLPHEEKHGTWDH